MHDGNTNKCQVLRCKGAFCWSLLSTLALEAFAAEQLSQQRTWCHHTADEGLDLENAFGSELI